jgi:hypothetical protein
LKSHQKSIRPLHNVRENPSIEKKEQEIDYLEIFAWKLGQC